jgi:hypothetical protein
MTLSLHLLICVAAAIVIFATYVLTESASLMTVVLLLFMIYAFKIDRTRWSIVFLSVYINLLFLLLAMLITGGEVSYLTDGGYIDFYTKSLLLEALFWICFVYMVNLYKKSFKLSYVANPKAHIRLPIGIQFLVAVLILLLEIYLSYRSYFASYSEVSDTGTVAYELGCLMLALAIISKLESNSKSKFFLLEMIAVALALFIVAGSGKRLPFAYIMVAYLCVSLELYGKLRTAILYLGIFFVGYLVGIIRDFMTVDGVDVDQLLVGFYSTNQGAILHASAVYLRVVDEGLVVCSERFIALLSNSLGALFLPISMLPEQAQVNIYAMRFYDVQGNGGFVGVYSYYFIGWLGPILIALFLSWFNFCRGRTVELISTIVILTSPRWTLYNIGPVFRLISMALIVIIIAQFIYKYLYSDIGRVLRFRE